ncbi:hypothetical protein IL306_000596 [Fusarium sp. DS 682]|nr:hypothetical protein IL306_000596 [Fusarium sp. DS 682]
MKAYFIADGRYYEDVLEKRYRKSVDGIAQKLHGQGYDQVGEVFFEFLVDHAVWLKSFHTLDTVGLAPEWPWKERPSRHDMSQGASVNYRQWRLDNGLSVPDEAPNTAPTEEPIGVAPPVQQAPVVPPVQQALPLRPAPVRAQWNRPADAQGRRPNPTQPTPAAIKEIGHIADAFVAENAASDVARIEQARKARKEREEKEAAAKAEALLSKAELAEQRHAAEIGKIKAANLKVADWADEEGEDEDEKDDDMSPIIPINEPLPVLPGFKANNDMPWMAQFPTMASRKNIWVKLYGETEFTAAILSPFEVALPPWLDFNRLVVGENQAVYNRVRRLISPILTIAWPVVNAKAVSLVVGVDPEFEALSGHEYVRLEVRNLWQWVCHWVLLVTQGDSMTLGDHFAVVNGRQWSAALEDDWSAVSRAHLASMENLGKAEYEARLEHEAEEQFAPELYAILQQPPRVAKEYLVHWVRRDMDNAAKRLKFAVKVWTRVAALTGKGMQEAFAWQDAFLEKYRAEMEKKNTIQEAVLFG